MILIGMNLRIQGGHVPPVPQPAPAPPQSPLPRTRSSLHREDGRQKDALAVH